MRLQVYLAANTSGDLRSQIGRAAKLGEDTGAKDAKESEV